MHEIAKYPDAFDVRPCGPRTYKPHRQRARPRFVGDPNKEQFTRWTGEERMDKESVAEPEIDSLLDRQSLCLPDFVKDSIVHAGDKGFKDVLRQYFPTAESNASERLVALKSKLRNASTHDFWGILMEEMCDITGSQCGFVAKRMLVDDQDSAVEMPELGEPGSCLMGVAFYINNGSDVKELYRDYRYHAYGTPCAHMKHDKVFIVPEKMADFLPNNPNPMPWKRSEAFIGLPLFTEGKCFAHFGMIWDSEGASKRKLGWSFLEMFLHSLEDMILQRILEGRGFTKEVAAPESTSAKVIPLSAITASQSLKPYARSLSHELRTPMQGVVGMLDIMYSTVIDAIANQQSERVRSVFEDLKNHIEVVQDSSKRAVEAADNVVHAYDMNMQMPETPLTPQDERSFATPKMDSSPNFLAATSTSGHKRVRSEESDFNFGPPSKKMFTMTEAEILHTFYPTESTLTTDEGLVPMTDMAESTKATSEVDCGSYPATSKRGSPLPSPVLKSSSHHRVVTRDFMKSLVAEILRSGQPTSEKHTTTQLGEIIEVETLGSRGEVQERTIHLNIEPDVPQAIITEEQHLHFSLQKVIDNAIKFTESGSITITVKLAKNLQMVEIWVVDTGCGIAEESKPSLFKPHFQEDASISRSRDGLGLSLFNAKAHVRKNLGGDVTLERSATEGPAKGSEFLIRLPISILESGSTETPLVGTPITSTQPCRPSPWADQNTQSNFSSSESIKNSLDLSSVPQSPRKRAPINRNLAKEYPLNILIAEDNPTNRNVAIGSLNKLGYSKENITIAYDGLDAVKRYQESLSRPVAQRFDAILMDIWMPKMDGYEATAKIMELATLHGERTTIVAVTADITEDCVRRSKQAGMHGFLAKPYKVLDIEHLILEHFSQPTQSF
ncbi:Histidine kinase 1 [Hyphodiscus hymeniophilus]|uniref:histidine kinase n=1 Tax=Hyphodiscus hymeniophilus TaxID=353542 RepID=A0A9P6VM34_9HELO|nr:Histidine kinase 1 [Hyphodiscus hymeniophilus]